LLDFCMASGIMRAVSSRRGPSRGSCPPGSRHVHVCAWHHVPTSRCWRCWPPASPARPSWRRRPPPRTPPPAPLHSPRRPWDAPRRRRLAPAPALAPALSRRPPWDARPRPRLPASPATARATGWGGPRLLASPGGRGRGGRRALRAGRAAAASRAARRLGETARGRASTRRAVRPSGAGTPLGGISAGCGTARSGRALRGRAGRGRSRRAQGRRCRRGSSRAGAAGAAVRSISSRGRGGAAGWRMGALLVRLQSGLQAGIAAGGRNRSGVGA
jgi:hypothetical protein